MTLNSKHTVALSVLELWKRTQLIDESFRVPEIDADKRRLWAEFLNEFECIEVTVGIRKFLDTLRNVTSRKLLRYLGSAEEGSEDRDSIALFIKKYISMEDGLFFNFGGMGPCTRERDAERLRNMTRRVGMIAQERPVALRGDDAPEDVFPPR